MKLTSKDFKRKMNYWHDFILAWYYHESNVRFFRISITFCDKSVIRTYWCKRIDSLFSFETIENAFFEFYDDKRYKSDLNFFRQFIRSLTPEQLRTFMDFSFDFRSSVIDCKTWNVFSEFVKTLLI